jgi:hypothetical protein
MGLFCGLQKCIRHFYTLLDCEIHGRPRRIIAQPFSVLSKNNETRQFGNTTVDISTEHDDVKVHMVHAHYSPGIGAGPSSRI